MTTTFRLKQHTVLPDIQVVEILVQGEVAGVIYPTEDGIRLVSAHVVESKTEDGFAGEVLADDNADRWPPIPSFDVTFRVSPYTIVGNTIIRIPPEHS